MATRMKQRRGTASQWTSTNNNQGPILEAGEIGFESDTGKFKIGDGANRWVALPYFLDENDLGGSLGDYLTVDDLGQPLKAASLDADGKLEAAQLPDGIATSTNPSFLVPAIVTTTFSGQSPSTAILNLSPMGTGNFFMFDAIKSPSDSLTNQIVSISDIQYVEGTGYSNAVSLLSEYTFFLSSSGSGTGSEAQLSAVETWNTNLNYLLEFDVNSITFQWQSNSSQVTISSSELVHLDGVTSSIQTQLDSKLDSSSLSGYATESYVGTQISNIVDGAPGVLDTLNELAAALGDDANYAATIITALGDKAPLNSPTFTGTVDFTGATVDGIDALPTQSGNAGKYLTTDGATASWAPAATETPHPFAMIG